MRIANVLRSPGRPLDEATRARMERGFAGHPHTRPSTLTSRPLSLGPAHSPREREADAAADRVLRAPASSLRSATPDFSAIRVHAGGDAAASARSVNAKAYTVANHIVFGAERYAPGTTAGDRLLAHELAHTLQPSAQLQRTIGDGHDLQAPRFSGNEELEAAFDDERLIRRGHRGPAVELLQQALIDAGFPLPRFGVDGKFGAETEAALKAYQFSKGLDDDGKVGPLTMGALDVQFLPPPVITSATVETSPGSRRRTEVGVGEDVRLTLSRGTAVWTATAGGFSTLPGMAASTVTWTAPDTAQRVTVTAGTATIAFDVIAPNGVHMDRAAGSPIQHIVNRADCGVQADVFLLPDRVNFRSVVYREVDVAGTATPGAFACNPSARGHCGVGPGRPCSEHFMTPTVVAGKGTQAIIGDCAYSGACPAPYTPGSLTISIPYEYRVASNPYRRFAVVSQVSRLARDLVTVSTDKAGAHGQVLVSAATSTNPRCPYPPGTPGVGP